MNSGKRSRARIIITSGGATVAAIAGPVDGNGVIHTCYNAGGNLKVIDASASCPKGYTALNWSQTGPQGTQGPQGPAGAAGEQGPKGDTGAAGPQGPAGATGPVGLQGPVGATGPQGPGGAAGNTVLNGTEPPNNPTGVDGDFYIDTAANRLYGPKANGTWPAAGTSLVGSQGPAGSPGKDGATGPAGDAGDADLQPFSAFSSAFISLSPLQGYTPVITAHLTLTSPTSYFVSGTILASLRAGDDAPLQCRLFVDGLYANVVTYYGSLNRKNANSISIPINNTWIHLDAGTHTIEVRCANVGLGTVDVGGPGQSMLTGFKVGQ
jgi:hypothetical protein